MRTPFGSIRSPLGPVVVFSFVLISGCGSGSSGESPMFEDPPVVSSSGGELALMLESLPTLIEIKKHDFAILNTFNGTYTPPTLRMQQGDTLHITQVNHLQNLPVNFHSHGVVTTPLANGDNVFVTVSPGETFDTVIPIPLTHSSGMYWYHPHVHPHVNETLSNGMAGALIIGDILAPFPELAGITERVMELKDLKLQDGEVVENPDPDGPTRRTINGLFQPRITIAPGELQFWRIGNMSANIFYNLQMEGVTFNVIAIDGNLQNQITVADTLLLAPGNRMEVLVRGPETGKYKLIALQFNTGPDGDAYPEQVMATLESQGQPVVPEIPLPTTFPSPPDLRQETPDVTRTVVFDDTSDPNVFVIDGQVWDRDRVDQTVELNNLEEWHLQNASAEFHVFHIHQGDFQITEINGVAQPFIGYQDVVNLPVAQDNGMPGEVVMRVRFAPPIVVGEFVYHCHIVQHEDQGMMGNVVVEDQLAKAIKAAAPRDLIAEALPPVLANYWCDPKARAAQARQKS